DRHARRGPVHGLLRRGAHRTGPAGPLSRPPLAPPAGPAGRAICPPAHGRPTWISPTARDCGHSTEGNPGNQRIPLGGVTTNAGFSPPRPAAQRHRQRCVTVATSATTSAMAESWAATIGSWRVRESDEDGRWDRETSSTSRRQALSG